ncbi:MAG: ATP-dependent zinc metalloprotease FtsH [Bacteroidetes bacterium]|nr:ATP-dependent zinc metalloprotease FtsH [Bacteroidota bacterium]MCL5026896.1 ATP-dependent zinc metalloprotease FtsH [Chloroflexota bacterium]
MDNNRLLKNSFVILLIVVAAMALLFSFFSASGNKEQDQMTIGQVVQQVRDGNIRRITVEGDSLTVERNDGRKAVSHKEPNASVYEILHDGGLTPEQIAKVDIDAKKPAEFGNVLGILIQFLPFVLLFGFLLFMMRQAQGGNNQALSFGKSRARMFVGNRPTVTFTDVAGADEAKQELQEVVEFLKYPEKFVALGARIPRGVLLIGPPGTGKTLLGRAVAGEAGVPFFSISGSEFVEMFVGVGASRVRDLFDQAKRNAPCIVFVDEIDAVGRQRGAGLGGSHDEREQTLNQILVEMDGFDTNTNVIVLAATNRPDILDPALLRPGRFDRQVVLDRPDINGRKAVLQVHAKGKPLDPEVGLDTLAKQTPGFSGADLANLVNEAAILAARRNKKSIGMKEFEEAVDRVIAGPERKSRIISEREKALTAYHEAGHAVVARMLKNVDPVHKVSIIARGMMGGYTRLLPTEDRYLQTKAHFVDDLTVAMGGRVAEELVFDETTTGASSDIEQATRLARKMVTEYGMSSELGPIALGHKEELIFLGREIGEQRNYSDKIAEAIDTEIHKLVTNAYETAKTILTEHRMVLVRLAERLIKDETLEGAELDAIFAEPAAEGQPADGQESKEPEMSPAG